MAIEITMPRLSDTMEEGTLVKWRVKVGDKVKSGDHLADVETDKATMELQAFDDGTVARLAIEEGQTTKVGQLILVLAQKGENPESVAGGGGASEVGQSKDGGSKVERPDAGNSAPGPSAAAGSSPVSSSSSSSLAAPGGRVRVSPLARKLAQERGIDLTTVKGTGPDGRIIKRDILAAEPDSAAASASAPKPVPPGPDGRAKSAGLVPGAGAIKPSTTPVGPSLPGLAITARSFSLSNMRKTIARRLVESKTTIPHFTVTVSVDMDALLALRQTFNDQFAQAAGGSAGGSSAGAPAVKLSVNDFIVRAVALALVKHPVVNSSWGADAIQQHGTVNVGVAVALPEERGGGLVVPVIRDVQLKGLKQISDDTRRLAEKARTTGLSVQDMAEGTFTLSNLGMFGVDHFEAIINPPQAAILAVGAALRQPVVKDGQIAIGTRMTCTLSADHRVVDGATAAQFLQTLKGLLEQPVMLLSWA